MIGLIGSDLEYAVFDGKTYIPAGLLSIKGTKGRPDELQYGGLEVDCCAAEITPPPSMTAEGFASNILNLLDEVRHKYDKVQFMTTPSWHFDSKVLKTAPHANVMGCDPDLNVWTGKVNPKPKPTKGLRSFGGHVHIEFGDERTIKACDLTLGMYSVLMGNDTERRKLYGKAGAFRYKPYGVEYRTLSNFWCADREKIEKVFNLTRHAQELAPSVDKLAESFGGPDMIQHVINTGARKEAEFIAKSLGVI